MEDLLLPHLDVANRSASSQASATQCYRPNQSQVMSPPQTQPVNDTMTGIHPPTYPIDPVSHGMSLNPVHATHMGSTTDPARMADVGDDTGLDNVQPITAEGLPVEDSNATPSWYESEFFNYAAAASAEASHMADTTVRQGEEGIQS